MILTIIGYFFFYLFLVVGFVSIFAGLPGTAIIFADVLMFSLITHFAKIDWKILLILGVMAFCAELNEHLLTVVGASKLGSSRRGIFGAIIGAIVLAIILSPLLFGLGALIGAVSGAFLGAFLLELTANKKAAEAAKVAIGSMFGRMTAIVIKIFIAIIQIVIIIWVIHF
jgi:uncharacterized protein YqgC (DUF456 family)